MYKWHSMAVAPLPVGNDRRCKCSVCGNVFSSIHGFDSHRVGEHGAHERRCVYPGFKGLRIRAVKSGREWYSPMPAGAQFWSKGNV